MSHILIRSTHGFVRASSLIENDNHTAAGANADGRPLALTTLPDRSELELMTLHDGSAAWRPYSAEEVRADLVRVETHTSRTLTLGSEALMPTLDDELRVVWRPPQEGLITPRIAEPMVAGELLTRLRLPEERPKTKNRFAPEVKLDFDFGWLIGIYIGEGWTDTGKRRNKINVASSYEPVIENLKRIVRRYALSGVTFTTTGGAHTFDGTDAYSEKHTFSSCRLATLFREACGRVAAEKKLPAFWRQAPPAFRWGLLSGLMDGDGGLSVSRPTAKRHRRRSAQVNAKYDTSSGELARGIVALGHALGLTATLSTYEATSGTTMHLVSFTQESIARMKGKLRLENPSKAEALEGHTLGSARRRGVYAPPLSRERLKELRKALWGVRLAREQGWTDEYSTKRRRLYNNVGDALRGPDPKNGRRSLSILTLDTARAIMNEIPGFFEEGYWARWKAFADEERIRWEIVTSAEEVDSDGEPQSATSVTPRSDSGAVVTGSGFAVRGPVE